MKYNSKQFDDVISIKNYEIPIAIQKTSWSLQSCPEQAKLFLHLPTKMPPQSSEYLFFNIVWV